MFARRSGASRAQPPCEALLAAESLQIFWIEHQLQLARLDRLTLTLKPLGLEKIGVRHEFQIGRCIGKSTSAARRRARIGQRADRSLPQPTVAENALDDFLLSALDEADDLHPAAAVRALQGVDLVDPFDQHRPGGNRAGARAGTGEGGRHRVIDDVRGRRG